MVFDLKNYFLKEISLSLLKIVLLDEIFFYCKSLYDNLILLEDSRVKLLLLKKANKKFYIT